MNGTSCLKMLKCQDLNFKQSKQLNFIKEHILMVSVQFQKNLSISNCSTDTIVLWSDNYDSVTRSSVSSIHKL